MTKTSGFRPDVSVLNSSIGEIGPMFQDVISVTIDSFILPELTRENDVAWLEDVRRQRAVTSFNNYCCVYM